MAGMSAWVVELMKTHVSNAGARVWICGGTGRAERGAQVAGKTDPVLGLREIQWMHVGRSLLAVVALLPASPPSACSYTGCGPDSCFGSACMDSCIDGLYEAYIRDWAAPEG